MKQNGKEELGYKDVEFYWPDLVAQRYFDMAVYTLYVTSRYITMISLEPVKTIRIGAKAVLGKRSFFSYI